MRLQFIEHHSLRAPQIDILTPFTKGDYTPEEILQALIRVSRIEGVAIFGVANRDDIIEVGHPYDL